MRITPRRTIVAIAVLWLGALATRHLEHKSPPGVRVMTIGGSVAHGWYDAKAKGYLHRAFYSLGKDTHTHYVLYDKTIVGANAVQLQDTLYKGDYEKWLETIHPNIVVLSWGLLNDALPKTPIPEFRQYVGQEIEQALAQHAQVFVVTPPVTEASYTQYKTQQQMYVNEEVSMVDAMNNPNVHLFNVFDQMKSYLVSHHQSYATYSLNSWHPNTKGHALAGRLLSHDIMRQIKERNLVI